MKHPYFLKSFALFILLALGHYSHAQNSNEYTPDEDIDQYLEKSYLLNKNAAYLDLTSIYGHKSLFIGYQRSIYKGYWAEIGIGLGLGKFTTKTGKGNFTAEWAMPMRYMVSNKIDEISLIRDYEDPYFYSFKPKSSFDFGVYKKVVGLPLTGQWSFGVKGRLSSYDIEYNYEEQTNYSSIADTNTMSRSSFYISLLYKMEIRRNLGLGYTIGAGPSLISFGDSDNAQDIYNGLKFTSVDYYGSLRLYFTF